ncbi:MAG: hypothetical protein ACK47B_10705 [Armatimonadota bacterium]
MPEQSGADLFRRRWLELRIRMRPLRDCPDMAGVEGLSEEDAEWLVSAIETTVRRYRGAQHFRPIWSAEGGVMPRGIIRRREDGSQ